MLLISLLLTLLLSESAAALDRSDSPQEQLAAAFLPKSSGRHFYLTSLGYPTNAALTACASGYHMASLWEILDVSNLTYDYAHPAAYTQDDSGYGPPSGWFGRVRTGMSTSGSSIAGTGNCLNWTSISGSDFGATVRLSSAWETAPGEISTWDAASYACNIPFPVWCVGNFTTLYLPAILK